MTPNSTTEVPLDLQELPDAWRQKAEVFMQLGDYAGAKQLRKCAAELEEAVD